MHVIECLQRADELADGPADAQRQNEQPYGTPQRGDEADLPLRRAMGLFEENPVRPSPRVSAPVFSPDACL